MRVNPLEPENYESGPADGIDQGGHTEQSQLDWEKDMKSSDALDRCEGSQTKLNSPVRGAVLAKQINTNRYEQQEFAISIDLWLHFQPTHMHRTQQI